MRVALYERVSTDEQARTGESILDQRQALERWARDHGHDVAGIYSDEGFSAHQAYKKRPALVRLLTDVEQGRVDLIAFTKFDRWTRKASDYYKLQDILDAHHVPWTAILEDYETVTASGRFKVGIMLSVNQHEAERTSERIKFTFAEKRRRGELISGNLPKGYRIQDGKPVKDPETEQAISAFWQSYLAGNGLTASLLAADAHGLHMAVSTGSFILRNARAYSGAIQGVSCDPYITPEEAEYVLSTRKKKPRDSGYCYLFAGLLLCGECGHRMGGHRNFWKRKDGSQGVQIYYNCSHRYNTQKRECSNCVNIYEDDIQRALLFGLTQAIEDAAAHLEADIREQKSRKDPAPQRLLEKLERKKRRAWEAYLDEIIEKEDYVREVEKIDAQIAALHIPDQIDEDAPRRIRETMPDGWREIYFQLDMEHRREFWRHLLEKIEIMPDRKIVATIKPDGKTSFTTQLQQPDGYWIEVIKAKE